MYVITYKVCLSRKQLLPSVSPTKAPTEAELVMAELSDSPLTHPELVERILGFLDLKDR